MIKPIAVLVIEDNPGDARLIKEILGEEGSGRFRLVFADRMSTGLELLDREEIDLVLLDLSLPDCQGLDALTLTHSKAPRLPIVLMTGLDDEDLSVRAMRLGAQDYLVKGQSEGRALVRSIRYALERKRVERLMRAQLATTRTLAESAGLDDAAPEILRILCDGLGWDAGTMWLRDDGAGRMRVSSFWHAPRLSMPEFEKANRGHAPTRGEDLVGRIWQKGKLTWVADLAKAEGYGRAGAALKDGLNSVLAFPLRSGSEIVGVIEFAARGPSEPDESMLESLAGVAGQVGQFVQRKQGEEALKAIEERFRSVVDSANDAIVIADHRGTLLTWNRGAEAIFGYTAAEVVGKPAGILLPERYREPQQKGLDKYLKTGESRVVGRTVELEGLRKSGEEFPLSLSLSSWLSGGEMFFGGIITDTTERQKVDRIKSEFISTVSHELRTPLTSILGSLGLVTAGAAGNLPAQAKSLIEIAHKNSERLVRLINDILDVDKIESGKLEFRLKPIRLMEVVGAAIESNRAYAEKYGVSLQLESGIPEAVVEADADRLTQVITNLLSNASKFSPRGQAVTISVQRKGPSIRVSVADRGPGIPEDFRPLVFNKFAQADTSDSRQKGGTGLGLNISKALIDRMAGRLGFETAMGVGSTFFFDLPEVHRKVSGDTSANLRLKPRVLVCEGQAEAAAQLAGILGVAGIETDLARDAVHARAQLALHRYQALTLDLNLPGSGGIAFLKELRNNEATRDLPVIVMAVTPESAHGQLEGSAVKVADVLSKPADKDRLLRTVKRAVSDSRGATPRILHVEDDEDTQRVVEMILKNVAAVTRVRSLADAREQLGRQPYDLVLLDPGLPDGAGLDLIAELKDAEGRSVPVVVFSADEFGEELSRRVSAALVKTRTSNADLVATIRSVLNQRGPRAENA
jgi:PAS domain S-box-containing protein